MHLMSPRRARRGKSAGAAREEDSRNHRGGLIGDAPFEVAAGVGRRSAGGRARPGADVGRRWRCCARCGRGRMFNAAGGHEKRRGKC